MNITHVRIKLMGRSDDEKLLAFAAVTLDDAFLVRDLKLIDGPRGVFVSMPSRKLTDRCGGCGGKNHLLARYCNRCGGRLVADRSLRGEDGRAQLYADIAHPITPACREMLQEAVVRAYRAELELAKQPGYVSRYDQYSGGGEFEALVG